MPLVRVEIYKGKSGDEIDFGFEMKVQKHTRQLKTIQLRGWNTILPDSYPGETIIKIIKIGKLLANCNDITGKKQLDFSIIS